MNVRIEADDKETKALGKDCEYIENRPLSSSVSSPFPLALLKTLARGFFQALLLHQT